MNMKKILAFALSLVLVAGLAVGGTIAWITDTSETLTNTFTIGDINISLAETTGETYKMIPGNEITKDPEVTVEKGSEASWLFVKLVKSDNFDDFLTYEVAEGWTALNEVDGVYWREVDDLTEATADVVYPVLKGDQVKVIDTVDKDDLTSLTTETYPTLTITAYAVQKDNMDTAADAWAALNAQ